MQTEREKIFGVVLFLIISLIFISLLFCTPKLIGFITSTAVYINTPPTFDHSNPISNQSFIQGNSLSDVCDLDDYFSDSDGDTLTYKAFGNSSVIVSINTSNGVSYSASASYSGSEVIRFVGDDGVRRNATSNNITITVNETGEVTPPSGGGGGGGGGGAPPQQPDFTINKEELKVKLKQGKEEKEFFKIKNNLGRALSVILDLTKIKNFLEKGGELIEEFILTSKEEKVIELNFFAKPDTEPDVYVKSIIISTENTEKELPVIIEVSSKDVFFDIALKIPEKHQKIAADQNMIPEITIFQLLDDVKGDVLVDLIVKDSSGKIVVQKRRTVFIASTTTFTEDIFISEELEPGVYILIAKATYNGKTAVVSKTFEVTEKEHINLVFILVLISLLVIAALLVLLIITMIKRYGTKTSQELKDINELILIAREYLGLKDRKKALETYRKIKREFNKLPRAGKKKAWKKVKALSKTIEIMKD